MNPSAVPLDSLKTALTGVREVGRVRRKAWATWLAAAQTARLAAIFSSGTPADPFRARGGQYWAFLWQPQAARAFRNF